MAVAVATSVPVAVAMALPVVALAIPTVAALEGLQFKHDVSGDAVAESVETLRQIVFGLLLFGRSFLSLRYPAELLHVLNERLQRTAQCSTLRSSTVQCNRLRSTAARPRTASMPWHYCVQ